MIGNFDETGYEYLQAPNAWSKGNGIINKNTLNFPSWQGLYQNCVLTDMGADDGYIYNAGDGYLKGDGVNNNVTSQYPISLTNVSLLTIEAKIKFNNTGNIQTICGLLDDGSNNVNILIFTDNKPYFLFEVSNVVRAAKSNTALIDGNDYTLHFIKAGGDLKIGVNGVEVPGYEIQDTYNSGNKTYSTKLDILERAGIGTKFPFAGRVHWFGTCTDTFPFSRALTNHNLGKDMGLIGNNVGDVMSLTAPGSFHLLNKRNELAYNGSQLR